MVHVSFDLVDEFIPRVPPQRLKKEDDTIPRICVAPNILSALQSIPQCGNVICVMYRLRMPIIIHAYYLRSSHVIGNKEVQRYVEDAKVTGEMWLSEPPETVYRVDYMITDFMAPLRTDYYGSREHFVYAASIKRVKHQDNWKNLCDSLYLEDKNGKIFQELRNICSFRTLMSNLDKEDIKILKERMRANERITDVFHGTTIV